MRHHLTFWKAMFKKPLTTGAVVPSSKKLCDRMLEQIRLEEADCVVELGPGTGVLTRRIVQRLKKDAVLLCIDCNPVMVKYLRKQITNARIIHDNAEHLKDYIGEMGAPADLIFSGIPFSTLPQRKAEKILETVKDSLKPDGKFVMFQYMHSTVHPRGKGILKILRQKFGNVKLKKVFGNIPPAFVFTCSKSL